MLLSTLKMQARIRHAQRFLTIAAVRCRPEPAFCSWPWRARSFLTIAVVSLVASACIYRVDIQQGNLLESDAIEQIELGMTRSQVQFLLGTPMVADAFHQNRWDYAYFIRRGRSPDIERRWIAVYFEEDQVVDIVGDFTPDPP